MIQYNNFVFDSPWNERTLVLGFVLQPLYMINQKYKYTSNSWTRNPLFQLKNKKKRNSVFILITLREADKFLKH